jgi:hypothetical protein
VVKFFNDSTGKGDYGDADLRGPWNQEGVEFVEAPAQPIAQATQKEVVAEIEKSVRRPKASRKGKRR